jgi:chromosome segregation ATPase
MATKDLRRMKRLELLDMMIEQGKQLEEQIGRNEELEERLKKLEILQQASDDRIGHLKDQVQQAAMLNDRLAEQARVAKRERSAAEENAQSLQRENTALAAKLEEARAQLNLKSEQALPGLASTDKKALRNLAARMESALQQTQAADKERTARIDAILENQQEILDGMTGAMAPDQGKRVSSVAAVKGRANPVQAALRIGPFGQLGGSDKKKKKKKAK